MKRVLLLLVVAFFVLDQANSQEISIATVNDYTACEGALVDSGLSAADYGPNENHSITWCVEAPETILVSTPSDCGGGEGNNMISFFSICFPKTFNAQINCLSCSMN